MDLGAYMQIELLKDYVARNYGEPPRLRGVRLMRFEEPSGEPEYQMQVFDGYCGQDVVYVHTRCGSACWGDDDPDANYIACGGRAWEESNPDTFIESLNDEWDGTYRDHYFKAVVDDEYKAIVESKGGTE